MRHLVVEKVSTFKAASRDLRKARGASSPSRRGPGRAEVDPDAISKVSLGVRFRGGWCCATPVIGEASALATS